MESTARVSERKPPRTRWLIALLAGSLTGCLENWDIAKEDGGPLDDASTHDARSRDAEDENPSTSDDPDDGGVDAADIEPDPGADADAGTSEEPTEDATVAGSHCGDGVQDSDEACDEGTSNSNTAADACRTNCAVPRCGDGVTDRGEECDDANQAWGDSCYECSRRHYFILNRPSSNSSGNDSITRADRRGHSTIIVGPDPSLNGLRELEISRDGSVLYATQANFGLMQNRLLFFDALTGAQIDQVKLDASVLGYDGSPTVMALGLNDLLYIMVHDNTHTEAKLITVDPATKAVRPIMSLGADFMRLDMTRDSAGSLYITTGSEIRTVQPAFMNVSSLGSLSWVAGIAYDAGTDTVWAASSQAPLQIVRFTSSGTRTPYATLQSSSLYGGRAILPEPDGLPLLTIDDPSKVVAVHADGTTTDVWTTNLDRPGDIEVIEFRPAR